MAAPVLFVAGPTATGKTALAIALARRFDGEIVNADSRQFYRGMDIGTAKPTPDELAAAPHHLIDVLDPDEQGSLGWFLDAAHAAIADIRSRGRLPIVAGGTGQYVRALLDAWDVPRVPPNPDLRRQLDERLAREGLAALAGELQARDPMAAARVDLMNARRVVRALEVAHSTGRIVEPPPRREPIDRALVLAIHFPRPILYERIDLRVDAMFEAGVVDEVRALLDRGWSCDLPAFTAIGYREVCGHLRGELTLDEARDRTKLATHRLARTQSGWFRHSDPRITWLEPDPSLVGRAIDITQGLLTEDPQ